MNIIELETNTKTEHHYHDKVSIEKAEKISMDEWWETGLR